ncbi:proline iminopeptidase-family hydrolase [Jatrophihabitans lederbergiae]|uniref:Proline iminopeptidase n=1 Tax=Jatrophihabitans lederbergiae TaxID=3075547 RepID=A0ABU2J9K3_9ACTN|nr:proline iminopeptidase-family hydrolase [Jatrophihabitans sp. DSM 44399]MDT0261670.1 proline iminopeptidase-family hydrolase [Jatrophihabitans sp. DSM 44399]
MSTQQLDQILPADREGTVDFDGSKTWYRITGDLDSPMVPLVVAHGGPGCTHDYLLRLTALARSGRPVIHYDQIGNGRSSHLPQADPSYWTADLFVAELENLLAGLGIGAAYHLLGQSWGGMLGAEFAVRRPAGLQRLIIADSPASMPLWSVAAAALRAELPTEVDQTLREHEEAGTTDSAEYLRAMQVFYDRHVCRVVPNPPEVAASFAAIEDDPTVYHTMNGPSEFHVVGSLKSWTVVDRLPRITVPTLIISGRYDEATPVAVQPFFDLIPDSRWRVFAESSHMPHVEETERYLAVVEAFLDGAEPDGENPA